MVDGAVIEVLSQGIRHAAPEVATRITAGEAVPPSKIICVPPIRLESGHSSYAWVNRSLFLATGGKIGATVRLMVYRTA